MADVSNLLDFCLFGRGGKEGGARTSGRGVRVLLRIEERGYQSVGRRGSSIFFLGVEIPTEKRNEGQEKNKNNKRKESEKDSKREAFHGDITINGIGKRVR